MNTHVSDRASGLAVGGKTDIVARLVAGRVARSAGLAKRSPDASHNELATDVAAADVEGVEGGPVVSLGQGEYRKDWWGKDLRMRRAAAGRGK